MKYRKLGKTGLSISEIGFGAGAIGGDMYGPTNDADSARAIAVALDLGCNFFDTADIYGSGRSEAVLSATLRQCGKLNDVIIATKGGVDLKRGRILDFSKKYLKAAIERSLKRLNREWIDVYQLHEPRQRDIEKGAALDALQEFKRAGLIRHFGISINSIEEGIAGVRAKSQTIQAPYNLFYAKEDRTPAETFFRPAHAAGIGIIARCALHHGFLAGKQEADTRYGDRDVRAAFPLPSRKYMIELARLVQFLAPRNRTLAQAAIRFVLDERSVSTTIIGIKSAKQAAENFAVSDMPALSAKKIDLALGALREA